jgi:IS6 family transposase
MMQECSVKVDLSAVFHWLQCYAPEIENRVRLYQRSGPAHSVLEIDSKWEYLFRAVDKNGQIINFMLTERPNT